MTVGQQCSRSEKIWCFTWEADWAFLAIVLAILVPSFAAPHIKTTDTGGLMSDRFGGNMELIQALHNVEAFLADKS
jgi:hypothetical protein